MRIGIIGATGNAGSAAYREAVKRGHDVTALVRNGQKATELLGESAQVNVVDAFDVTAEDLAGFDAVIDAFATIPTQAHQHVELAQHLVNLAGELTPAPRLVFILGAGSLHTGEDHHLYWDDILKHAAGADWLPIPENQMKELEFLRGVDGVGWVGVSPQSVFAPGEATTPVLGVDELLFAADGKSHTSTGNMAVALLDEIEHPAHHNMRFTVSD